MSAKTKDKMLKNFQGRNVQDGKEQKKCIWNDILFFYMKSSLYWGSTTWSEDVCITPEHSPPLA